MLSLRENILLGTGSGRVFLIDDDHEHPEKILSGKSSIVLASLLSADSHEECLSEIRSLGLTYGREDILHIEKYLAIKYTFALKGREGDSHSKKLGNIALGRLKNSQEGKAPLLFRLDYPVHITYVPTWHCRRGT